MYYVNPEKRECGAYRNPQTANIGGFLKLPNDLLSVFVEHNGFVNLIVDSEIIIDIEPNTEAWEAWKETLNETKGDV